MWMGLRSTRHAKYWCAYHFVWMPKHRKDILVGDVAEYAKAVLREIAEKTRLYLMPSTLYPILHNYIGISTWRERES